MASLIQRPDSSTYYIQYMVSGKAKRVSTGTDALQIAKAKLREFETAKASGEESLLPTKTPIPVILSSYLEHIRSAKTKKSARTDIYYLRDAFGPVCEGLKITSRKISAAAKKRPPKKGQDRRRSAPVIASSHFEAITTAQISAFIAGQMSCRGLSPKTGNRIRDTLSDLKSPKVTELLKRAEVGGRAGPWILLNGYFNQRDLTQGVAVFCKIRGLIVPKSNLTRVKKHLAANHPFDASRLNSPQLHYAFVGEAGWADTIPAIGDAEWPFVVRTTWREAPAMSFIDLDDKLPGSGKPPKPTMWKQNVYDNVKVLLPCVDNNWESYHTCTNPGRCPPLLGREISESLSLRVDAQSSEFFAPDGSLASTVAVNHEEEAASQEFVYLRTDLLNQYLSKHKCSLMWIIDGQRELYSSDGMNLRALYEEHGYPKSFRSVLEYPKCAVLQNAPAAEDR